MRGVSIAPATLRRRYSLTIGPLGLIVLLHQTLNYSIVDLGTHVLFYLFALALVLAVHDDYDEDERHVEDNKDDKLDYDHSFALGLVVVVGPRSGLRLKLIIRG